jgi:GNAT superfamily N-acetyltransferase
VVSRIIFYFTGTGNSYAVANKVAKELGETELVPITRIKDFPIEKYSMVGIVYPVYYIHAPEIQGKGIGTKLLEYIENDHKSLRKELFTSDKSIRNIRLYERCGYTPFKAKPVSDDLNMIYLEKDAAK